MNNPKPARYRAEVTVVLAALAVSALVLAPLRHHGAVLYLDAVMLPVVALPSGLFLLGPDAVRRFPLYVPLWLLSTVVGGELAWRFWLLVLFALTGVGMDRFVRQLAPDAPLLARVVAIVWLPLTPFVLTRVSTGHVEVIAAMAVVPWVLCQTVEGGLAGSRSRAVALAALLGPLGGVSALICVAGAIRTRHEVRLVSLRWIVRNAVWIVPGAVVAATSSAEFTDPAYFVPKFRTISDVLGYPLGTGYWDRIADLQWRPSITAAAALVLVALAGIGWTRITESARRILVVPLVVGYGVPILASLPVVGPMVMACARTPVGLPFREPHRLVGIGMVALVGLAAVGIGVIISHMAVYPGVGVLRSAARTLSVTAVLAGATIALVGNRLERAWSRLEPTPVPEAWQAARRLVSKQPGTALVLPWHEYVLLPSARGPVYNPLPDIIGGDVLASLDPELGPPVHEGVEPRAGLGRNIDGLLRTGDNVGPLLDQAAVQWVVIVHTDDWGALDLSATGGLTPVLTASELSIYRYEPAGLAASSHSVPFIRRETGGGSRLDEPARWGWWPAQRTPDGVLLRAEGRGHLHVYLLAPLGHIFLGITLGFVLRRSRDVLL